MTTLPRDIRYQLFIDGQWEDITQDVYTRDRITITRGRPNEAQKPPPAKLTLTLKNHSLRYSSRNPESDLFGKIGRNTVIRVGWSEFLPSLGVTLFHQRFIGEITKWPQRENPAGTDQYVPIEASGITGRLEQGSRIASCLRRRMPFIESQDVVGYWPLEDGEDATQFESVLVDNPVAELRGEVEPGAFDGIDASLPLPVLNTGKITAFLGAYDPKRLVFGDHYAEVSMVCRLPDENAVPLEEITLLSVFCNEDIGRAEITFSRNDELSPNPDSGGGRLYVFDDDGVEIGNATVSDFGRTELGRTIIVQMIFEFNTSIDSQVMARFVAIEEPRFLDIGWSPVNVGTRDFGLVSRIALNQDRQQSHDFAAGHVTVWRDEYQLDFVDAAQAFREEVAQDRIDRLMGENGISGDVINSTLLQRMGSQRPDTTMNLIRECADVDGGILKDSVGSGVPSIAYIGALLNQQPVRVIDWADGQILPPFRPVEDDQRVRNDVEIKRPRGSSSRHVQLKGRLSIQDPPDGVGRYDERRELNCATDEQVAPLAQWHVHRGTIDMPRFPEVTVSPLKNPEFIGDVLNPPPEPGGRITLINLPLWAWPEDVDLMVEGYKEVITGEDWKITYQTSPFEPFIAGVLDSAELGRLEAKGISTQIEFRVGIDTTLRVTGESLGIDLPAFTIDSANYPLAIRVSGALLEVTSAAAPFFDIETSSNVQDLTVEQSSINGIVKVIPAGSVVELRRALKLAPGFRM